MVEDAFTGSLAFGLTSCDPTLVPSSRLPADSDELLERPEYWVCIKDVAAMPQVGDKLSFQLDSDGRVLFSKNEGISRVIMHVDISIPLWAFFDLYGSTRKIQLLDLDQPGSSYLTGSDLVRNYRASSEGCSNISTQSSTGTCGDSCIQPTANLNRPSSASWNMGSLRVALPAATPPLAIPTVSQPPTASSTTASTVGTPLAAATSLSSSSAPSFSIDPAELVRSTNAELSRLRANIAHRLNLNERETSNSPSNTTNDHNSNQNQHRTRHTYMADLPTLSDILARRRLVQAQTVALPSLSSSPRNRDRDSSHRDSSRDRTSNRATERQDRTTAFADILESPLSSATTPLAAASITVPLLPPPLFSSLAISGDDQNRRNRAAEFERNLDRDRDEETAPADDGNGDGGNECSICMNSRVNAVIYRCGHMCMCYPCAKETHRRSGDCPICRTPIIDVIRCYPV